MTTPWHQHASVPLRGSATAIHRRLVADPDGLVATATGDALSRLGPLVRSWGLAPRALPTVTAHVTGPDQVGAVELRWSGEEDDTAWPSLVARLLVVPGRTATDARLVFLTPRSPRAELATDRIGRPHRERVVDGAVQRFLREMAEHVGQPDAPHSAGPRVTQFDRRPIFVHHLEPHPLDPTVLARHLVEHADAVATTITATALEAATAPLAAGQFREPPAPSVHVGPTPAGSTGVLDLGWSSDEEATGWPRIRLTLAVEAADPGSRLVILSHRMAGYDLSVNRMDKRQRDQVLRELGPHVAAAVTDRLSTVVATPPSHTGGAALVQA